MWYCAGIVFLKPGIQVIGDAGVEMFPSETLEDVDIFHDLSAFAEISTSAFASIRTIVSIFQIEWDSLSISS
jgi:hypothetical protein